MKNNRQLDYKIFACAIHTSGQSWRTFFGKRRTRRDLVYLCICYLMSIYPDCYQSLAAARAPHCRVVRVSSYFFLLIRIAYFILPIPYSWICWYCSKMCVIDWIIEIRNTSFEWTCTIIEKLKSFTGVLLWVIDCTRRQKRFTPADSHRASGLARLAATTPAFYWTKGKIYYCYCSNIISR